MAQIFISHSSKGDPLAGRLRDRLVEGLRARNHDVRVDVEALRPGQDWCPVLYTWLAECDAAIILFNEAALDSHWVMREVNILMWRRALNPSLLVVPVLVGDVTSNDLRDKGFTDVLPVQVARLAPGACQDDDLGRLADSVLREFADLPDLRAGEDHMRSWISKIATYLKQTADQGVLTEVARALGVPEADLGNVNALAGGCTFLAHQLLGTSNSAGLRRAINAIAPHIDPGKLGQLVAQITPTWINAEAARRIIPPPAQSERRAVLLNACEQTTAGQYVDRAMCLQFHLYHFEAAGGIPLGEDTAAELLDQCVESVRGLIRFPPTARPAQFRPRAEELHCLSIDVSAVRPAVVAEVLQRLHDLFPWLLIILLTGDSVPDAATVGEWKVDDLVVLSPLLAEEAEFGGYQLTQDLRNLLNRLNGQWR
ncbi:toll/interleukin-1 receptor domain-containing protein [Kitasatospora sp. NBC_01302]|uniref:toll/interleukin-1 receptor domain-containing protein n=1 Tax=Kitasatospora sp. NBC_01302 TaxID=2903575 RepID=UPI002E138689|nr:toll/interleukin-1 receptor domain-containing protein [Kitasatospora sp. NBC_01302]